MYLIPQSNRSNELSSVGWELLRKYGKYLTTHLATISTAVHFFHGWEEACPYHFAGAPPQSDLTKAAALSPIMIAGAAVFPDVTFRNHVSPSIIRYNTL